VKAIGQWAKDNPVHAYILWQMLKEMVPGVKRLAGFIDKAPDIPTK
jgi:hypothetical protein